MKVVAFSVWANDDVSEGSIVKLITKNAVMTEGLASWLKIADSFCKTVFGGSNRRGLIVPSILLPDISLFKGMAPISVTEVEIPDFSGEFRFDFNPDMCGEIGADEYENSFEFGQISLCEDSNISIWEKKLVEFGIVGKIEPKQGFEKSGYTGNAAYTFTGTATDSGKCHLLTIELWSGMYADYMPEVLIPVI